MKRTYKIEINGNNYPVQKISMAYSADKSQIFWYANQQDRDKDIDGLHPELVLSYTKVTPKAFPLLEQCELLGVLVAGNRASIERKWEPPRFEIAPGVAAIGESSLAHWVNSKDVP